MSELRLRKGKLFVPGHTASKTVNLKQAVLFYTIRGQVGQRPPTPFGEPWDH